MVIVDNVKNLYNKVKNSSAETRYKAILRGNRVLTSIMRYVILIAIGYIILYPLFYMISSAIRTRDSFFDPSIVWITSEVTWENFDIAMMVTGYASSLVNTIVYEIISAIIQIMSCSLVAYGLARFEFKEKKILTIFMFLLIIVPSQMIMLPTVTTYKQLDVFGILGLVNSLTGIDIRPDILGGALTFYLPALFGVGIRAGIIIYIYIQFFKGLPKELEEAAWIDGAGPLKTYLRIALPSSGVVITTVSVFSIIWHWNDSYLASIYLDQSNWPLAVKLSEITNYEGLGAMAGIKFGPENPESVAIVMAACLLFVLPVLIMYMILQNKFVKSIDRVGITG